MVATRSNTRRRESSGQTLATVPLCVVLTLLFCVAGCDLPGRPNPADRPVPADQVLSFSALFGSNCAGCHGVKGRLGPAPPLNDPIFRSIVPASELEAVVTNGRHKSLMPAFGKAGGGTLTATQIQVLVHEIKGIPYTVVKEQEGGRTRAHVVADPNGIAPAWGPTPESPASIPAYHQPVRSEPDGGRGSTSQGAMVFSRACAVCHGKDGQGIRDGNETRNILNDRVALNLITDQALRRYVITGRPDLGMPNYAGARPDNPHFSALTDREVADVVALLASWRQEADAPNKLVKD